MFFLFDGTALAVTGTVKYDNNLLYFSKLWEIVLKVQGYIFFVLWPDGEQVCSGNFGEPQVDPG